MTKKGYVRNIIKLTLLALVFSILPISRSDEAKADYELYQCVVGLVNVGTDSMYVDPGQHYGTTWAWEFIPPIPNSGGGQAWFYVGPTSYPSGITTTSNPTSTFGSGTNVWEFDVDPNITPGTYTLPVYVDVQSDWSGTLTCNDIYIIVEDTTPDFTLSCTPSTQSIVVGGTTSYALSTTGVNGFSSQVNFSASVSPNVGSGPSISFTNNNQVPDATTTAVVSTTSSTPANTYTITFTGTGGGQSHDCTGQLVVNPVPPPPPGFDLTITPATTDTLKGSSPTYTVSATCVGGFTGPVHSLSATSEYTGITYTFSNSQVACGSSVTLTIGNTSAVPQGQLSTPQTRLPKTITVQGQGN